MTISQRPIEWAKRSAPALVGRLVSGLDAADLLHTIVICTDGPEDDPSMMPLPQVDTASMPLAETLNRLQRSSVHVRQRMVINIFRTLNSNEDGNYPVWIFGIDRKSGERFLLGTAVSDTPLGPRLHDAQEIDQATLDDLLDSWDFPPSDDGVAPPEAPTPEELADLVERMRRGEDVSHELGAALARQEAPTDTAGMSQGEADAHVSGQLQQILSDAIQKIELWASAHPEVTDADLDDTLMIDRGATWGHEPVPSAAGAMSLRERLVELLEHMRQLDSPTTLARFRHDSDNYLFALYADARCETGALVKVTISSGQVTTKNLDLVQALG